VAQTPSFSSAAEGGVKKPQVAAQTEQVSQGASQKQQEDQLREGKLDSLLRRSALPEGVSKGTAVEKGSAGPEGPGPPRGVQARRVRW
jgi:hypothetical protein